MEFCFDEPLVSETLLVKLCPQKPVGRRAGEGNSLPALNWDLHISVNSELATFIAAAYRGSHFVSCFDGVHAVFQTLQTPELQSESKASIRWLCHDLHHFSFDFQ